jgi:hypothetical protein
MCCAPKLVFGCSEGVGSRYHVLRTRTHFRRFRGCWVPFSCFASPYSFSAVPRESGPVFMFCVPVLVFGGTEGVGSRFHVLRRATHFTGYRRRRILFSCFARPNSFSTVPTTSGPVFMFCAPGHVFNGANGDGSRFHVLRSRTLFQRYRGRPVPFSCVVLPNSFSAVPRASGPVYMFCAPEFVFGGSEDVGSRFHVLRPRTRFRRYRGSWVPFSFFASPYTFSAVPRASSTVFIFCAPELVSAITTMSGPVFMFCEPGLIFGGTVGVGFRFHVLRSRMHFRRFRGCRVPFSCFASPYSFSTVPWESGPVFMFCVPVHVFGGTVGTGSCFHILRARTRFRRYRRRRVPFSCFALPDSYSAVPRASSPVFMFCVPVLVFGDTEGVGSRLHVSRSRTHFRRYRGCQLPFSCFAVPDSFSTEPRASAPVFM